MAPIIDMPVIRQLPRNTDRTFLAALFSWNETVVYELAEHYVYTTWIEGRPINILLPAGFRTDLASTPSPTWLIGFRPDGHLLVPGLIHDWYYRHGYLLTDRHEIVFQGRGKLWADKLFASIAAKMIGIKTPGLLALIALAICGWPAWWNNEKYRNAATKTGSVQLKGDYNG